MKTIRFYYKLRDLFNPQVGSSYNTPYWAKVANKGLYDIINDVTGQNIGTDNLMTKELLQEYLYPTIFNSTVCYVDVECNEWDNPVAPTFGDELFENMRAELIGDLWTWLKATQSIYEPLITYYTADMNNLMKPIENESFSRYNDTPQESNTGLDDDAHASNTNKTISKTQGGTVMARLNEIRILIRSYYADWAKSWRDEFVLVGVE